MLPVVIIGADATVQEALAAWPRVHAYHTVEEAQFSLADLLQADAATIAQEEDSWQCSVVYGHEAAGLAVTGQPQRLAHTGWTIVAHHGINDRPGAARRVVGGKVGGEDVSTMVWQASTVLRANFVLDVSDPDAVTRVRHHLTERAEP